MKKSICFIVLICSLYAVDNSVALIDFESINIRDTDADALTQRLNSELIKMGKFTVLERSLIQQVIEEQKFQYSGNVDMQTVSDIGSMTGADYVIVGTISKIGGKYFSVDCRMIEVETSSSVRGASYDADDIGQLLRYGMKDIASQLSGINISDSPSQLEVPRVKQQEPVSPPPSYATKLVDENRTESWYYYITFPLTTSHVYPDGLKNQIDDYALDDRIQGGTELFGIYFHLNPKILGGLVYDYSNDYIVYDGYVYWDYENYTYDLYSLNLTHTFIGLSAIGFYDKFGEGVFGKIDIGSTSMEHTESSCISYKYSWGADVCSPSDTAVSESGTGFGLGVGYSWYFKQLKKTRVFASLNVSVRNIDMKDEGWWLDDFESYSKSSLNLGFIF